MFPYGIKVEKMCFFWTSHLIFFALQLCFLSQHSAPHRAAGTRCECNPTVFFNANCTPKTHPWGRCIFNSPPFCPNSVELEEWEMSEDSDAQQPCVCSEDGRDPRGQWGSPRAGEGLEC